VRRRNCFAEVYEAFWKQEPRVKQVLSQVALRRVFIVPLFISEGYFSEEVIPRALGFQGKRQGECARVRQHGSQTLFYTRPVGTHDSMTSVLLARAREVVEEHPIPYAPKPAETTLLLAGHGTEENQNSRKTIERQAELIRAMGIYAAVEVAFMEEDPRIRDCYALARTRNIVIVPFFISDGLHVKEDIPELLGEAKEAVQDRLARRQPTWTNPVERNGKLVWYAPSVGTDPHLADVILERAAEAWSLYILKAAR
jgi:sirohydrochlorin cobaltochelatase